MNNSIVLVVFIIAVAVIGVYFNVFGFFGATGTVTFVNDSEYDISPGVLVVHGEEFSMNHLARVAPDEYEPLAEVGNPSALIAEVQEDSQVYAVVAVDEVVSGSQVTTKVRGVPADSKTEVSYMAMIVQSNDGVVWANRFPFTNEQGDFESREGWLEILDMGTEQNSPLGSGFEGGQPDPSQGERNIENGVSTPGTTVQHHPQFYDDPSVSARIVRILVNLPDSVESQ